MALPADELLVRLAHALRHEIGPAVEEPFAKTQAFMAAVILTKLAAQLRTADADVRAADEERSALVARLRERLGDSPSTLHTAITALERDGGDETWSALVRALHGVGDE